MNLHYALTASIFVSRGLEAAPSPPVEPKAHVVWQIEEGLSQPESVLYDGKSRAVYISNVAGSPVAKDGAGWITKADSSGKVLLEKWVSGLNAPKGLAIRHGKLYTADIDELVEIDVKKGLLLRRIPVPEAKLLNDVAIDMWGKIYVSDTLASKIYVVEPEDGRVSVFAEGEGLESPNGLYIRKGRLFVAAWGLADKDWATKTPGRLYSLDLRSRERETITGPLGNLDGLEPAGDGSWYVSDWVAGNVLRVFKDGKAKTILSGFKGPADLGRIDKRGLLLIPRMKENRVTAYDMAGKRKRRLKPKKP